MLVAVALEEPALFLVVIKQRHGLSEIHLKAFLDSLFLVVSSLVKLAFALIAKTFFLGRLVLLVEG